MVLFDEILKGIKDVGHSLTTTVDPHLKNLEDQYNQLKGEYNSSRLQLVQDINTFQSVLQDYRSMAACNSMLLICGQVYDWPTTKFDDFLTDTKNAPQLKKAELLPSDVATLIKKSLRSNHIVNYLNHPVKANKYGLSEVAEFMSFGGIGTPSSASLIGELLSEDVLSGIADMVIGDIIYGETEYPKQIRHLKQMHNKLKAGISRVNTATSQLRQGIKQQRRGFISAMQQLASIQKPTFNWYLGAKDPDAAYHYAMVKAVQQYAIIFKMRNDWKNYLSNIPTGSYEQFVALETSVGHSGIYSNSQVEEFIWLIAQVTTDSLYDAWVKAGRPTPAFSATGR